MNKILKIVCVVIILICILGLAIYFVRNNNQPIENDEDLINSGDETLTPNESMTYIELEELPYEYTLEQAKTDKCVVIEKDGQISNKDLLDDFMENVENNFDANVRIVQETDENTLIINDLKYTKGTLAVVWDETRVDEEETEIYVTEYDILTEYLFFKETTFLEDGTEMQLYRVVNNSDEREYEITIISYAVNLVSNEEKIPNEFEAVVKAIDDNFIVVEPVENATEKIVSDEIYVSTNSDVTEVGQRVKITYTGEITELSNRYEINTTISIESIGE